MNKSIRVLTLTLPNIIGRQKTRIAVLTCLFFMCFNFQAQEANAQTKTYGEKYGTTLNLGLGLGYYGYLESHQANLPVLCADLEFDVAKNFTLAPFLKYYQYSGRYYWGDNNHPKAYYHYTESVIPIGVKGTYYFDELFNAGSKWDFYAAGSVGFNVVHSRWDDGYYGDKNYYHGRRNGLYLDLHAGAEYHLSSKVGLYLDLSSGVSSFGLALHF